MSLKALANVDTLLRTHCWGHTVADTNVSPFARARNISCGPKFCVRGTKSVSDFVQKHFVPATKVPQFAQHGNTTFIPCVCAPKKHHEQQCVRTMCTRLPGPFTLSDTSRLRFALQQYPISIKERRFVSSKALWNYTRLEPALHPSGSCLSELTTGSLRHARKFVIKSGA